jgi:hypothetical protein
MIEGREVSGEWHVDFHKLINICVENLMEQKYFLVSSARGLPCAARQGNFDRREIRVIEYEIGRSR